MRSDLKAQILDTLHNGGVEIMTPSVMNQRPLDPEKPVVPVEQATSEDDSDHGKAERMMFDRADLAARIERFREHARTLGTEIKELEDQDAEKHASEISWRKHQIQALTDLVEKFDSPND
jgi:hypothetical protein